MSKNGKGARVNRRNESEPDIYATMTINTEPIDKKTLIQVFESIPSVSKYEQDELDRKIEMGKCKSYSGEYKPIMDPNEQQKAIQLSRSIVKERTSSGLKFIQKSKEEIEKMETIRREAKLKKIEESKAAEKKVTPEQLELIRLRREIKRLQKNADTYKIVERKGVVKQTDSQIDYSNWLIALDNKIKRADVNYQNLDVYRLVDALNILDRKYSYVNKEFTIEEPVVEIVKEEVILSKWDRIKLEARNWLRRQANKLIVLLQKI